MKNRLPEKQIIFLSMVYISLFFASITVGYKIVVLGHSLYCASVLIFPLLFPLSDALSEIYGSSIAKSMIWYSIICEIIFVCLTNAAIHLPSPTNWHHQTEYNFLVGGYAHILMANVTALLISFYLNILFLNKWRILLKGKHYYLRSLGATAIGEITFTVITNIIAFFGVLKWSDIFNVIVSDYLFKLVYSVIIAYPAALFVIYIKMKYSTQDYFLKLNLQQRTTEKVTELTKYTHKAFTNSTSQ